MLFSWLTLDLTGCCHFVEQNGDKGRIVISQDILWAIGTLQESAQVGWIDAWAPIKVESNIQLHGNDNYIPLEKKWLPLHVALLLFFIPFLFLKNIPKLEWKAQGGVLSLHCILYRHVFAKSIVSLLNMQRGSHGGEGWCAGKRRLFYSPGQNFCQWTNRSTSQGLGAVNVEQCGPVCCQNGNL